MLIDSHLHLDDPVFDPDRDQVLARAQAAGVTHFITIGAGGADGFSSAEKAVLLAEKYEAVYCTVGVHPLSAGATPPDRDRLFKLVQKPKVVGLGETGLDFYYEAGSKKAQEEWFQIQIELAAELKKPLVIHSRTKEGEASASAQILAMLTAAKNSLTRGGVFHCYPEDSDFAKKLLDLGFYVSFPGIVTFKKADVMQKAAREIPLSQILLETDAPYLAPVPYRGKRCESAYMVETARMVAEVKGVSLEEVCEWSVGNTRRLFGI